MSDEATTGLSPAEQKALQLLDKVDQARFDKFAEEFHAESDRAAVVLGAAKLDELLRELLSRCLLTKVDDEDELLSGDNGGDKPLSSFSARINGAYRLGLISAEFRRSLHFVRRIRNRFAHRVSTVTLNDSPCREYILELSRPIPSPTFWTQAMQTFYGDERTPRVEFRIIVAVYTYLLESAVVLVKRLPEQPLITTMVPEGRRGR